MLSPHSKSKRGLWDGIVSVRRHTSGVPTRIRTSLRRTMSHFYSLKCSALRGAWRDHRFPEPFSWFLHETGLESLKITSARCFVLTYQRKFSKKATKTPPVSWRPWALAYSRDRPYNVSCLSALSKNGRFGSFFSRLWGVIWRGRAFHDQQCQFLTRNKSLSIENESNCSMTSECVRTDSILPRGAGLEHGRYKQLIFSLSIFGILVERLSF